MSGRKASARNKVFEIKCEHCKVGFITWKGNPKRFCSASCGYKNRTSTSKELFNKNTIRNSNGCLDYIKSTYTNGYGRILIGKNKHQLAHRFSWEMHNGTIPENMCVLHKCDRPVCCEITHLFLGTNADNSKDMVNKGRHNSKIGEYNRNSKLTDNQVLEIKESFRTKITCTEMSKKYNVHPETIRSIKRGERWTHIKTQGEVNA